MWQIFDIVKFKFVKVIFIIGEGQDQVVIWYVGGEIGEVVVFVVCVVIVIKQEDMMQFFMVYQINQCISSVKQCLVIKIYGDKVRNFVVWEVCYLLCLGDNCREIIIVQMMYVRLVNNVVGLDMIVISVYGWVDDVV